MENRVSRESNGLQQGHTASPPLLDLHGDKCPSPASTPLLMSKVIAISLSHNLSCLGDHTIYQFFSLDFIIALLFSFFLSLFDLAGNYSHLVKASLKGTLMGPTVFLQVSESMTSHTHCTLNGFLLNLLTTLG